MASRAPASHHGPRVQANRTKFLERMAAEFGAVEMEDPNVGISFERNVYRFRVPAAGRDPIVVTLNRGYVDDARQHVTGLHLAQRMLANDTCTCAGGSAGRVNITGCPVHGKA